MLGKLHPIAGVVLLIVVLLVSSCRNHEQQSTIIVFAAASLSDVAADLAGRFQDLNPEAQVVLNLSASSILARQIIAGANYDVFLSANENWIAEVNAARGSDSFRNLAITNELVVIRSGVSTPVSDHPESLLRKETRIAIADPAHVPAGMYAQSALECAGIWDDIETNVIPTLDVRAAVAAVQSGNANVGVVYSTDAAIASMESAPLDSACQPAIVYAAMLNDVTRSLANEFYQFVDDSLQHDLWTLHGFDLRHD